MKKTVKIASTLVLAVCITFGTAACGTGSKSSTTTTMSVASVAAKSSTNMLHIEKSFGTEVVAKAAQAAEEVQTAKAEEAAKQEEEKRLQEEAEKAAKKTATTTSSTNSNKTTTKNTTTKKTTTTTKTTSNKTTSNTTSQASAAPAAPSKPSVSGLSVNGILQLVNYERNAAGLGSLSLDGTLCQIAADRAPELAQSWSHTRPDGTDVRVIANAYGYSYRKIGENLAKGYSTSEKTVNAWMNSASHKQNIMGAYTRTGIAIVNVGGRNYIVQLFAN